MSKADTLLMFEYLVDLRTGILALKSELNYPRSDFASDNTFSGRTEISSTKLKARIRELKIEILEDEGEL